jgi:hypothetical protein
MTVLAIRKKKNVGLRRREGDSWALTLRWGCQVLKGWVTEPFHILDLIVLVRTRLPYRWEQDCQRFF